LLLLCDGKLEWTCFDSSDSFLAFANFFRRAWGESTANSCVPGMGGGTKEEDGEGNGDGDAARWSIDSERESRSGQKDTTQKVPSVLITTQLELSSHTHLGLQKSVPFQMVD
jgi:hypothetical protein